MARRQLFPLLFLLASIALLYKIFGHQGGMDVDEDFNAAVKAYARHEYVEAESMFLRIYPKLNRNSEEFVIASRSLGDIRREHFLDTDSAKKYYDDAYSHIHQVKSATVRIEILVEYADILNLLKIAGSLNVCKEATVEVRKDLAHFDRLTKLGILMSYRDSLETDPDVKLSPKEIKRLLREIELSEQDIQQRKEPRFFLTTAD